MTPKVNSGDVTNPTNIATPKTNFISDICLKTCFGYKSIVILKVEIRSSPLPKFCCTNLTTLVLATFCIIWIYDFVWASSLCTWLMHDTENLNGFTIMHKTHSALYLNYCDCLAYKLDNYSSELKHLLSIATKVCSSMYLKNSRECIGM